MRFPTRTANTRFTFIVETEVHTGHGSEQHEIFRQSTGVSSVRQDIPIGLHTERINGLILYSLRRCHLVQEMQAYPNLLVERSL